eukprot:TRINITY_DN8592_c0_g1_i1.p1 TRINITY_DN8592_c0_g1~~TRINITY_DN8592_c0_g1_i1.p1  ORF type:complete len:741 (-),score=152.52 TRINITY_DN8592_c0_g1_i1:297-2519(-)
MTMAMLRGDPSLDYVAVGAWSALAHAVASTFVPERAPLLLTATVERGGRCPPAPELPHLPPPAQRRRSTGETHRMAIDMALKARMRDRQAKGLGRRRLSWTRDDIGGEDERSGKEVGPDDGNVRISDSDRQVRGGERILLFVREEGHRGKQGDRGEVQVDNGDGQETQRERRLLFAQEQGERGGERWGHARHGREFGGGHGHWREPNNGNARHFGGGQGEGFGGRHERLREWENPRLGRSMMRNGHLGRDEGLLERMHSIHDAGRGERLQQQLLRRASLERMDARQVAEERGDEGQGDGGGIERWAMEAHTQEAHDAGGMGKEEEEQEMGVHEPQEVAPLRVNEKGSSTLGAEQRPFLGQGSLSDSEETPILPLMAQKKEAVGDVAVSVEQDLSSEQELHCAQHELAELFVLGQTRSLVFSFPSPATEFILARIALANPEGEGGGTSAAAASGRSGNGAAVCASPPITPIIKQRIAAQIYIDEKVKVIYCSIPKVACTSWKTWFRQVAGLPNPNDTWIPHIPGKSGLKELWLTYSEADAMRLLTRPDFFKFTFVRNPLTRLASVFLEKHIRGGVPYSRRHWNRKFFSLLPPAKLGVLHSRADGLLRFQDFVGLVGDVMQLKRQDIEPHIAPQTDMCMLDSIKYDFIGHFETLDADVAHIMARLGTSAHSAFSLGKAAHPTNSTQMLTELYGKQETIDMARHVYSMDFNIPLNSISYDLPIELRPTPLIPKEEKRKSIFQW